MYGPNTTTAGGPSLERVACLILVGSEIAFGVSRFWDLVIPAGYVLTPAFAAVSFLIYRTADRLEVAARSGAWLTFCLALVMGLVCVMLQATMSHSGLDALNAREGFAPTWSIWPASIVLSLFNLASPFAFEREIPKRIQGTKPRAIAGPKPAKRRRAMRGASADRIFAEIRGQAAN